MNTKSTHNNLKWAACLMACLPFAAANAVPQYSVSDLGSLGGTYSLGLGVNNSGLASGFSHLPDNVTEYAIVGQSLTLPQDLGTLGGSYSQASGINNLGQVVGSASLPGDVLYHAFLWQGGAAPPLAPLKDLNALVNPGYSRAFSINVKGQTAGFSSTLAGTEHAVVWDTTGAITDLGTINLNNTGNSQGLAINSLGQVAGFSTLTGNTSTHAVLWSNGTKRDLGTLGGTHSAAYAINTFGEVTGSATTALDTAQHAFLWQPNLVPAMKDLGTLAGGTFSEGYGISGAGDVVGYSTAANDSSQKAFLWQSSIGLQDLNTLIDPASGWTLLEAHGISEDGSYITGIGTLNGERHAFLLKSLIVDTTPPLVSFLITPAAPGAFGWYVTAPSVVWTVTDAESAISKKVGCTDVPSVADTAGQLFTCSATSQGGTAPTVTTTVKVDTAAPVVIAQTPAPVEATGASGATVSWPAPVATDVTSGLATGVSCSTASGSTFALGSQSVNCSATDLAGNIGRASFNVTVSDTTRPVLSLPANITTSTTSIGGTAVTYVATANDTVSGALPVTCSALSGSNFIVGATPVDCTSSDAAGNVASGSFTVTVNLIVVDTVAPVLSLPGPIVTTAATVNGTAVVNYTATATDAVSGIRPVICLPSSGSTFNVGTTIVDCSATDAAGNKANGSFTVTVNNPITTATTVDLKVGGSVSNALPRKGDNVTYTYVVNNIGTGAAQTVTFSDVLPISLRFSTLTTSAGTCTRPNNNGGGTVSCPLNTLAAGATATVTITAKVDVTGAIANTGRVSTSSVDVNAANNAATVSLTAR